MTDTEQRALGACADCGASYDDPAWVEAIVPHADWIKIDPTITAILCVACMARRAVALGLPKVEIVQLAGPLAFAASPPTDGIGEVTQADRDEAAAIYQRFFRDHDYAGWVRSGAKDDDYFVRAFARHRLAAPRAVESDGVREGRVNNFDKWLKWLSVEDNVTSSTPRKIARAAEDAVEDFRKICLDYERRCLAAECEAVRLGRFAALQTPSPNVDPDLGKIGPGHVCKHDVRWPHACLECDALSWAVHQAALSPPSPVEGESE
jgi:hypothetical protein